jgi:hypothetical protein
LGISFLNQELSLAGKPRFVQGKSTHELSDMAWQNADTNLRMENLFLRQRRKNNQAVECCHALAHGLLHALVVSVTWI